MKYALIGLVAIALVIGVWLFTDQPAVAPSPSPTPSESAVVGGDRDEHGCIGSAGYTWCENRGVCLRVWEESCYDQPTDQIRFLLATKYGKEMANVTLSTKAQDATHMAGGVSFGVGVQGGSGLFLATVRNGVWQVVYDGNGSVDCDSLRSDYGFTDALLTGFCDPLSVRSPSPVMCTADAMQCPDGTWVGRTGPRCEFVCP